MVEKAELVAAAFVYGDSLHSVLVAVVCPDADAAKRWAAANGAAGSDLKALCGNKAFKAEVEKQMEAVAKEARLQGFEKARGVMLEPEPWTPEDLLTPSFKLKRADAKKKCVRPPPHTRPPPPPPSPPRRALTPLPSSLRNRYQKDIDAMYIAAGDLVAGKAGLKQGAL